ncbi:MAG: terminase small subunit [Oscillospiraceae bacterium]
MKKKIDSDDVIRRIGQLAFGKANDAVKLVLLDPQRPELIDRLDLSLLSEVKRGANGVMEIKLLNRLEALELLAKLLGTGPQQGTEAESFFRAMDRAAERLGAYRDEI